MFDVAGEQLGQGQIFFQLAVNNGSMVDSVASLKGRMFQQVIDDYIRIGIALELDDYACATPVCLVNDSVDIRLGLGHPLLVNSLDKVFDIDVVRSLGDNDVAPAPFTVLYSILGANLDAAMASCVCLAHIIDVGDNAARGKVRTFDDARHISSNVLGGAVYHVLQALVDGRKNLNRIMRCKAAGYAYCRTKCTVDEQVREKARQNLGFHL